MWCTLTSVYNRSRLSHSPEFLGFGSFLRGSFLSKGQYCTYCTSCTYCTAERVSLTAFSPRLQRSRPRNNVLKNMPKSTRKISNIESISTQTYEPGRVRLWPILSHDFLLFLRQEKPETQGKNKKRKMETFLTNEFEQGANTRNALQFSFRKFNSTYTSGETMKKRSGNLGPKNVFVDTVVGSRCRYSSFSAGCLRHVLLTDNYSTRLHIVSSQIESGPCNVLDFGFCSGYEHLLRCVFPVVLTIKGRYCRIITKFLIFLFFLEKKNSKKQENHRTFPKSENSTEGKISGTLR